MTASTLTVRSTAPANVVRAWLKDNGFNPGTRGKFSAAEISAYNKNNALKYVPAKHVPTKEVTVTIAGRKRTRKVNVLAARNILRENGQPVGRRGRLTVAQFQNAYDLSVSN
jgi:hypothetical protein